MKKGLSHTLFFIFFLFFIAVEAQTPHVDSLKKALELHLSQDTTRVHILIQICKAHIYETNDMDQLEYYNAQLYPLAKLLNASEGLAYAYLYKGILSKIRTDYPQARLHLDHALNIFKTLKLKQGIAACYINLGLVEDRVGNYTKAIEYANAAAKIRNEYGDIRGTASALNNLAISYGNLGDYKKSLNSYFKSLQLRESINDKLGMSVSYLNIGDSYNIQGKYDESEKFLLKALPLKKELGDKEGEAYVYANLASIATSRKNFKKALILHLKALKLREEMGDKQNINQTYVFIGKNYFDQQKYPEALSYYLKAYESSKGLSDYVNYIEGAVGAGKCYERDKNYSHAIQKYNEAFRIAKQINYRSGLSDVLNSLASVQEKLQNYKEALSYQKSFTALKDSMLNEASFKQAAELNARYETDKKEKEILLLTKDQQLKDKTLKQQRLVRIGLISGLALLFILSFLLFNRYQYKQKANVILKKQKQEITEQNTQIVDSIDYAKNIQEAILPDESKLTSFLKDYFILYRPKAIVSGDFYWITKKGTKIICAVADCTGHGVPGAFMSLLGHNILETVVQREMSTNPGAILTALNEEIVARFSKGKQKETVKHGMDIAIISFDSNKQQLEYAGARNSLYLVREHRLI